MFKEETEWKLKSDLVRKYPDLPKEELEELASVSLEMAETLIEIYAHYNLPKQE